MTINTCGIRLKNEVDSSDPCLANDGYQYILLRAQKRCRKPLAWGLPAPKPKESGSARGVCSAITPQVPTTKDDLFRTYLRVLW